MATRESMDDETFGKKLVRAYDSVAELHDDGVRDEDAVHPRDVLNGWLGETRAAKARDAESNTGLGPRELEQRDHGADDPGEFAGKPPNPAHDSANLLALEEARIRQSGSATLESDLWAARAKFSDPAKVRAMENAIPALRRLK